MTKPVVLAATIEKKRLAEEAIVDSLWKDAKSFLFHANQIADQAVVAYVKVGTTLLALRELYPGDKEFGQARKKEMPNLSAKWAGDLMRVARNSEVQGIPHIGISVMKELAGADSEVIEAVKEAASSGQPPTVKEVRAMVRAPDTPDTASDPASPPVPAPSPPVRRETPDVHSGSPATATGATGEASKGEPHKWNNRVGAEPPPVKVLSPEESEAAALELPFEERFGATESALVTLGLSQFCDNLPCEESIIALIEHYCRAYPDYKGRILARTKAEGLN